MLALGLKPEKRHVRSPGWAGSFRGPKSWILLSKGGNGGPRLLQGWPTGLAWWGGREDRGSGLTAMLCHHRGNRAGLGEPSLKYMEVPERPCHS